MNAIVMAVWINDEGDEHGKREGKRHPKPPGPWLNSRRRLDEFRKNQVFRG